MQDRRFRDRDNYTSTEVTAISTSENEILQVGDTAPDITLQTHSDGEHNLKWYRGRKNVILAFYPADWTPVCATQIPGYVPLLETFQKYDTQVIGISVDSVFCHKEWAKSLGGIPFPLMSDYYPHGATAEAYGVLSPRGYSERSVFVIDKEGVVRYIQKVKPADLPDNDKLIAALKEIEGEK